MPAKKNLARLWIEKRMCGDYRPLNLVTLQDRYPMPIHEKLFDNIGDSNIFTIVDLRQGFNQMCSLRRIARKQHSMEATSCGNGLWCLFDWRMHLAHLEELFKRLHEVNMKIHPKKYEFAITSVVYLGHKILPNGIMAHWAKVVAILEMPNPTDVHTLKSFIRLCNYYRIYV